MENIRFYPLGDTGVTIEFGEEISTKTHHKVRGMVRYLEAHPVPGMVEFVPGFTTVTVFYDPFEISQTHPGVSPFEHIQASMEKILASLSNRGAEEPRIVRIPVCYDEAFGPDLAHVAKANGLSEEEVIGLHSGADYLVYMIGFAPGFPYLGGMPERIATPRRSSPRLVIPAGSVGIGGKQTGIYPIESPGGWQLIGRTPVKLFDPGKEQPSLLQAGDVLRFYPITREEYDTWEGGEKR